MQFLIISPHDKLIIYYHLDIFFIYHVGLPQSQVLPYLLFLFVLYVYINNRLSSYVPNHDFI